MLMKRGVVDWEVVTEHAQKIIALPNDAQYLVDIIVSFSNNSSLISPIMEIISKFNKET